MELHERYGLYRWHSGGGCSHFAYDIHAECELYWLINDDFVYVDNNKAYYEPSHEFPTDENQLCVFGLDINNLDLDDKQNWGKDTLKEMENLLYKEIPNEVVVYSGGVQFHSSLKEGVPIMKRVSEKLKIRWRKCG